MKTLFAYIIFLCFAAGIYAQDTTKPLIDESKMTTYYMAFLYRGDKWTPEVTDATKKIQEDHLKNITRLADSGKLILAGPFLDNTDLRGIFVFKVDSMEEAKKLCDTDPAVQAGRLRVEIKPWYSAKGITIQK